MSKITEEEKREILEYEALVKELTESWKEVEQKTLETIEEIRRVNHGCGHPSEE